MPRALWKLSKFAWILPLALATAGVGCGFQRDVSAVQRLRAKIQAQTGREASVNVHSAYGSTTVTIRFTELPSGDSLALQDQVETLVKAEFPKTEYVVVLGGS